MTTITFKFEVAKIYRQVKFILILCFVELKTVCFEKLGAENMSLGVFNLNFEDFALGALFSQKSNRYLFFSYVSLLDFKQKTVSHSSL